MNWDWEKLQDQRRRQGGPKPPDLGDLGESFRRLGDYRLPEGIPGGPRLLAAAVVLLWLASGIYIVHADEVGVVKRFGAYHRTTTPGPHLHWPFPIESVETPRVTEVRRVEVGFRSPGQHAGGIAGAQGRQVPDESLMLTGDENIVDVQFIVQYQIKDPTAFLFNVDNPAETVKSVAQAAMRETMGSSTIDLALTTGKVDIQNETMARMQRVLDAYHAGLRVVAVQLQDVHPPKDVVEAFKDVASAREDKSRFMNESEAYRNDILPKARGQASMILNQAQAYKESQVLQARGGAERFSQLQAEYSKAREVTAKRLYLEAMERILANPDLEKLVLTDEAARKAVPYLPLERATPGARPRPSGGQGERPQ